jgi:hypothetical protein
MLDRRHHTFALLYLAGIPAGRAYERAGYRQRGARADSAGHKLRHHPEVAAFIDQERERSRMSAEITRAELISLLGQIIFTPIAELDADSPLVQEFSRDEIGGDIIRHRVRMVDKLGAAKQLCQIMGWDQPERQKMKFEVAIGGLADE